MSIYLACDDTDLHRNAALEDLGCIPAGLVLDNGGKHQWRIFGIDPVPSPAPLTIRQRFADITGAHLTSGIEMFGIVGDEYPFFVAYSPRGDHDAVNASWRYFY